MTDIYSYPPAYLNLFKKASEEVVCIRLGDDTKAQHLRFRLYNLRRRMRDTGHYLADIANSVQLFVQDGNLIARPADSEFVTALSDAGISNDLSPADVILHDSLNPPTASGSDRAYSQEEFEAMTISDDDLSDFLSEDKEELD